MHPVILTLISLFLVGTAIKFDNAKLKAALAEGGKDPEKIPCWNATRWGENPYNIMKILRSNEVVECWRCPCKLVAAGSSNLNICDKCDLKRTRELANNHAESKFKADEIANCGASSTCAKHAFRRPKTCEDCPHMFDVETLNKFMGLLAWLEGLKE